MFTYKDFWNNIREFDISIEACAKFKFQHSEFINTPKRGGATVVGVHNNYLWVHYSSYKGAYHCIIDHRYTLMTDDQIVQHLVEIVTLNNEDHIILAFKNSKVSGRDALANLLVHQATSQLISAFLPLYKIAGFNEIPTVLCIINMIATSLNIPLELPQPVIGVDEVDSSTGCTPRAWTVQNNLHGSVASLLLAHS